MSNVPPELNLRSNYNALILYADMIINRYRRIFEFIVSHCKYTVPILNIKFAQYVLICLIPYLCNIYSQQIGNADTH